MKPEAPQTRRWWRWWEPQLRSSRLPGKKLHRWKEGQDQREDFQGAQRAEGCPCPLICSPGRHSIHHPSARHTATFFTHNKAFILILWWGSQTLEQTGADTLSSTTEPNPYSNMTPAKTPKEVFSGTAGDLKSGGTTWRTRAVGKSHGIPESWGKTGTLRRKQRNVFELDTKDLINPRDLNISVLLHTLPHHRLRHDSVSPI